MNKNLLRSIIFLFPLAFISLFILLKINFNDAYILINWENGFIENLQTLIYFVSSIIAFSVAFNFFKKGLRFYGVLYAIFSLGLFFICMEEIGWGYKLFDFAVPDYFKTYNVQSEISLHNMQYARGYVNEFFILTGFFCAFAWLVIPGKIKDISPSMTKYLIPDKLLFFYFLPVFIIYVYIAYISGILVRLTGLDAFHIGSMGDPYVIKFIDQEPAEFLLALGLLIFLVLNKYRQTRQKFIDRAESGRLAAVILMGFLVISIPAHFIHVFVSDRTYPYDRLDFGNSFYLSGRVDEAITQYRLALEIDPHFAKTHGNLGVALRDKGRLKEAEAHFSEALRIKPDDAMTYDNMGLCLFYQGRHEEALLFYSKALEIDPKQVETYWKITEVLLYRGDPEGAVGYLAEALKIQPGNAVTHNNMGNALIRQGKVTESIWHYSEAIRLKPDYSNHYNLGLALLGLGKFDEAADHFKESIRYNPDNEWTHSNLANALAGQGDLNGAIAHYSEALRLKPDFADVHCNLGIILKLQGKREEAIYHFSEALRINPNFEKARKNLKELTE